MSSFIGSILASIGGGGNNGPASGTGQALPSPSTTTRSELPKAPKVKTSSTDSLARVVTGKRKAESDLGTASAKSQRMTSQPGLSRPPSVIPSTASQPVKTAISSSNPILARGSAQSTVPGGAPRVTQRQAPSTVTTKPLAKAVSKAPLATAGVTAPKKGSYLDILARAKAAQEAKGPVGIIKHKPVERLTKKERAAQLAEAKGKSSIGTDKKLSKESTSKPLAGVRMKPKEKEDLAKKPSSSGYQGTMRPAAAEPAYRGTMNRLGPESTRKHSNTKNDSGRGERGRTSLYNARDKLKGRHSGYDSYSDEEEEGDEDEYASDGSSDMEAGAFELDIEEQQSLRFARKEDEEALKEENELKRQKEERRRMLQQMAADASKKRRF